MADMNDAIQQFLQQMMQQGSTGTGHGAPFNPPAQGSTGQAESNLLPSTTNLNPEIPMQPGVSPRAYSDRLPPPPNTTPPNVPPSQVQAQPFSPQSQPSPVQDQGAGQPAGDGYQLPGFVMQAMMQLLGKKPGGPSEMDRREQFNRSMAGEYGGVIRTRPENGMSEHYAFPGAMVRR